MFLTWAFRIYDAGDGITKRLDGVITCTDVRLIDNPNLKFNSTSISPSFDTRNENDGQTCSDSSIKYKNSDVSETGSNLQNGWRASF